MKRFVMIYTAWLALTSGVEAWAQTAAPRPGYHFEQVEVPDSVDTLTAPTPTPNLPQGQSSASAQATGPGASAQASVDPNFHSAFPRYNQGFQFGQGPQGRVWNSYWPQPQQTCTVQERFIRQQLITTVYPSKPVQAPYLLPNKNPCRGNLLGRCRCARHSGQGVGLNMNANVGIGFGGSYY